MTGIAPFAWTVARNASLSYPLSAKTYCAVLSESSASACVISWAAPWVTLTSIGLPSESTSACILLLKTPQLRPRPSCSRPRLPFLRAHSVLMSTHNRGVQHQLFNVCCYGKQPAWERQVQPKKAPSESRIYPRDFDTFARG